MLRMVSEIVDHQHAVGQPQPRAALDQRLGLSDVRRLDDDAVGAGVGKALRLLHARGHEKHERLLLHRPRLRDAGGAFRRRDGGIDKDDIDIVGGDFRACRGSALGFHHFDRHRRDTGATPHQVALGRRGRAQQDAKGDEIARNHVRRQNPALAPGGAHRKLYRGWIARNRVGGYAAGIVSRKRTASPPDGAVNSPSHITCAPRTNVPTGHPVTVTPS